MLLEQHQLDVLSDSVLGVMLFHQYAIDIQSFSSEVDGHSLLLLVKTKQEST
jgi:hypothetical protein